MRSDESRVPIEYSDWTADRPSVQVFAFVTAVIRPTAVGKLLISLLARCSPQSTRTVPAQYRLDNAFSQPLIRLRVESLPWYFRGRSKTDMLKQMKPFIGVGQQPRMASVNRHQFR